MKKAHEFVSRGVAVIEDGMLRYTYREHGSARQTDEDADFWNGSPLPKLLRKVNPNRLYDPDCGPVIPMHRPGEVRS